MHHGFVRYSACVCSQVVPKFLERTKWHLSGNARVCALLTRASDTALRLSCSGHSVTFPSSAPVGRFVHCFSYRRPELKPGTGSDTSVRLENRCCKCLYAKIKAPILLRGRP